jgi:hypothetical protein
VRPQLDRTRALPPPIELLDLSHARVGELVDAEPGAPSCATGKGYWGIGMQFDLEAVVINVPQTYPAFQAGIRRGDVLANSDLQPDRAGYETVEFTRHGKPHRTRVKTSWICLG